MKINDYYTSMQRQSSVQLTPGSNIYGAFWSNDFFFFFFWKKVEAFW
jgi:hypothetical protein